MTCDGITGGYYVPKEPPKTGTVKTAGTTPSTVGTANRNNVSGSAIGDALLHYGQNTTAAASSAPTTPTTPTTPTQHRQTRQRLPHLITFQAEPIKLSWAE